MVSHLPRDRSALPTLSIKMILAHFSRHFFFFSSWENLSSMMGESSSSSSSASSYIRMVQHLIENCLLLHMNKDDCVEALFKQADIKPVITSTVWSELEKENKEFFEAYAKNREESVKMHADTAARRGPPEDDEDDKDG